jgi:hypothetical protein
MEEVVGEDVVSETEVLRQPDKDIAIIIAAINDPHFFNRAMLKTAVNLPFMMSSLKFLKSPLIINTKRTGKLCIDFAKQD